VLSFDNNNTNESNVHLKKNMIKKDVIIIGAGASGIMCAIYSGKEADLFLFLIIRQDGKKNSHFRRGS